MNTKKRIAKIQKIIDKISKQNLNVIAMLKLGPRSCLALESFNEHGGWFSPVSGLKSSKKRIEGANLVDFAALYSSPYEGSYMEERFNIYLPPETAKMLLDSGDDEEFMFHICAESVDCQTILVMERDQLNKVVSGVTQYDNLLHFNQEVYAKIGYPSCL